MSQRRPFGRLSLRYKFLIILALILVSATGAYFGLAISLFNTDKKAYVYDNVGALVETLGEEVATGILSSLKSMRLAALADVSDGEGDDSRRQAAVKALFDDDDNFIALQIRRTSDDATLAPAELTFTRDAYLSEQGLPEGSAQSLTIQITPSPALLLESGLQFQNVVLASGMPLLAVSLGIKAESGALRLVVSALLRQDRRLAVFRRSSLYTSYLIDSFGNVLAHTDPALVTRRENFGASPFIQKILASPIAKGVSEHQGPDEASRIVAYKKLGVGGLVAVTEIPTERAFLASRRLIEKSALFAVLIFALAFLVSILFSRRLTAALHKLYTATLQVAKGDFQVEVSVASEDEVGALSRAFNHMTREINRLLIETADKARMEKELETAQLVQDNFFPKGDLRHGSLEVSAYFKPASECGGDWWGSLRAGDQLVLMIGDATGHGVPAALITAAAHSCATTLSRLSERLANFELSPGFIMDMLNAAIFHAGKGRVKMTFLVVVIDTKSGALRYCNASHELPVLYRAPASGVAGQGELDSFGSRPDACLGESLATVFVEHQEALAPNDALVLYTDGLAECRNAAGEEYGDRRLTKNILRSAGTDAAAIKDRLMDDALSFYGKDAQEDDITLVVVRRLRDSAMLPQAS